MSLPSSYCIFIEASLFTKRDCFSALSFVFLYSCITYRSPKSTDLSWVEGVCADEKFITAYKDTLSGAVTQRLLGDSDFDRSRFPNASRVFLKS